MLQFKSGRGDMLALPVYHGAFLYFVISSEGEKHIFSAIWVEPGGKSERGWTGLG